MKSDVLKNFNEFKTFYLELRNKRDELDENNKAGWEFYQTCLKQLQNEYPKLHDQFEYIEREEMNDESDHP